MKKIPQLYYTDYTFGEGILLQRIKLHSVLETYCIGIDLKTRKRKVDFDGYYINQQLRKYHQPIKAS